MRIKSLTIHGFGKFKDKTIHFDDGINVVYGLNEGGKSTLHKYIEAMFYGFFKPHTKKRQYEATYEDYLPWDFNGYGGTLTLSDNDRDIRIERHFAKGNEGLRVVDAKSGEDITETYDYNKVIREVSPGLYHFGHNKITYRNTLSITQMAHKTDDAMIAEIKDNMNNLASTHQSVISVDKVLGKIDKIEKAIGSPRKKTSDYYKCQQRIRELQEERSKAHGVHVEIAKEKNRENTLLADQEALEVAVENLRLDMAYLEALSRLDKLEAAERLSEEMESHMKVMSKTQKYGRFTAEVAEELRHQWHLVEQAEHEEAKLVERAKILEDKIESLMEEIGASQVAESSDLAFERAEDAIRAFDESLDLLRVKETEQQGIREQKANVPEQWPPERLLMPSAIIGGVVVIGVLAALMLTPILWVMPAMGLVAGMAYAYNRSKRLKAYEAYRLRIDQLDEGIGQKAQEIDVINQKLKDILQGEGFGDFEALKRQRDRLLTEKTAVEQEHQAITFRRELLAKDRLEAEALSKDILEQGQYISSIKGQWQDAMKDWELQGQEDITEALKEHMSYGEASSHYQQLSRRLEALLQGSTLLALRKEAKVEHRHVEERDINVLSEQLTNLIDQQMVCSKRISASTTRQLTLSQTAREVAEIDEEIAAYESQLKAYDHQLSVAAMMRDTIRSIADETQNNFAPTLNKAMSRVVSKVTNNRYSDIKVNPELALTVYDKVAHKTIPAECLSAGTIDILYFGLRLGVSEVLTEGKVLPLILDDPFVQYDDERIRKVMDLLADSGRQVLLFTCHQREMVYLQDNKLDYNRIDL